MNTTLAKAGWHKSRSMWSRAFPAIGCLALLCHSLAAADEEQTPPPAGWENVRSVKMSGGLRAFWDVNGAPRHQAVAIKHGFDPVNLLNDYSDYPGRQKRNINHYLHERKPTNNPWDRPDYFEELLRRNIGSIAKRTDVSTDATSLFVHDIEFDFEQDMAKAWADPVIRRASGATTLKEFQEAYLAKWAEWFWLPCRWGKEICPKLPAGLYGPQPFRRDYWGIVGKDAAQIDGTHALDAVFWKHIDPHVDFYIASVYIFYDDPGSVYYIASNVEENFNRTRQFGNKPVYAYSWLRYHNSNKKIGGLELAPWLVDATAVVPYFHGARGNVLWGWEPQSKGARLYGNLPVYADSLGRVADLSEKIAKAEPAADDEPAHALWKTKRPLLRRLRVRGGDDEWIVLAMNPWQMHDEQSEIKIRCGKRTFTLELQGRHCDIFHIIGDKVKRLQVDYGKAGEPVNNSVL
ncbi:MAG: hypothetical protein HQ581_03100 [Planctomycetes bacterium]|nr:hypothetical protein [Planctomycetota bacterium]